MKQNYICETTNSRMFYHLTNKDTTVALISAYRSERTENENQVKQRQLMNEVRKLDYGYIEFIARWSEMDIATKEIVSSDEESLMIPNISFEEALDLGKQFDQSSIIYKDENGCKEYCTTPFMDWNGNKHDIGDVVQVFNNVPDGKVLNIKDAQEIFTRKQEGPASLAKYGRKNKVPYSLKVMEQIGKRASTFTGSRYNVILEEYFDDDETLLQEAGYYGYSMSNNAVDAYENGEKPKSKWTKDDIIDEIENNIEHPKFSINKLSKLPLPLLKRLCLTYSSWHHTSSYYNSTDFYSIDYDFLEELTDSKIDEILKRYKEEQAEEKEEKRKANEEQRWECEYLEWSGTRKHPKAKTITDTGVIKGNWFYPDNSSGKKSTSARGFYKIKRLDTEEEN